MRLNKFFKWANPGLFSFIFGLFKEAIQFLQKINVKNVHPVYGAGIQTHDPTRPGLPPTRRNKFLKKKMVFILLHLALFDTITAKLTALFQLLATNFFKVGLELQL